MPRRPWHPRCPYDEWPARPPPPSPRPRSPMDTLLKDLRFAVRSLRKQPAFTTTVVATLALAIGASTAIFSVVEATLLPPLPFRDTSRVAFLWGVAGPHRAIRRRPLVRVGDWGRP